MTNLLNNQKLITFCIPAYNSAPFLHFAVDSLLPFGEEIEVIIIDDGSKDDTGKVADDYAKAYSFIKVIHQPNGGHGEGINNGLKAASGVYFKVLDSDDWVAEDGMKALLSDLHEHQDWADLYLTNYTYWQGRDHRGQLISFGYLFRKHNYHCGWKNLRHFTYRCNLTLHSAMFKTSVLRSSGVHCPGHVSYEDNYFIYAPLPYVKNVAYVPHSLYQYLIGREGQSMENATCIRKYHDYMVDGKLIFDSFDLTKIRFSNRPLYRAMYHHLILNFMMVPTFARLNGSPQAKADLKEFWAYCKKNNKRQYHLIRRFFAMITLTMPGKMGVKAVKLDYKFAHHIVDFN
jgi:glycosyltransferase involved in cell wall biosynthesis